MDIAATTRARLEMQGFVGLDDERLAEIRPWLRLAPGLCAAWAAVGTAWSSPALLWALVPFAALGALRRGHAFDVLYNHGLRHLRGTRPLPPYAAPRRFACGVATVWLAATAAAFGGGATILGYALGAAFVMVALIPATIDFCIPSFFFGLLFGWPAACEHCDLAKRPTNPHAAPTAGRPRRPPGSCGRPARCGPRPWWGRRTLPPAPEIGRSGLSERHWRR